MQKFRILSMDGGGIRGIISAIWLREILRRANKPASECFDLIVGTSTGAITAATAAYNMDLETAVELYHKHGPRIFPPHTRHARRYSPAALFRPIYGANRLHRVLLEHFGKRRMSEASTKLLIPAYRTFDRRIELMRSYSEVDHTLPVKDNKDWSVWEACKASSSAPTYFAGHVPRGDGRSRAMIDGGMFANNPALLGIAETVRMLPGRSLFDISREYDIVIVSLGTGRLERPLGNRQVQSWGMIGWVRPAIDIFMSASSEMSAFCSMQILPDEAYVRMQVDLVRGAKDDLDDASVTNLDNLVNLAQSYAEGDGDALIDDAVQLVATATPLNAAWRNHI